MPHPNSSEVVTEIGSSELKTKTKTTTPNNAGEGKSSGTSTLTSLNLTVAQGLRAAVAPNLPPEWKAALDRYVPESSLVIKPFFPGPHRVGRRRTVSSLLSNTLSETLTAIERGAVTERPGSQWYRAATMRSAFLASVNRMTTDGKGTGVEFVAARLLALASGCLPCEVSGCTNPLDVAWSSKDLLAAMDGPGTLAVWERADYATGSASDYYSLCVPAGSPMRGSIDAAAAWVYAHFPRSGHVKVYGAGEMTGTFDRIDPTGTIWLGNACWGMGDLAAGARSCFRWLWRQDGDEDFLSSCLAQLSLRLGWGFAEAEDSAYVAANRTPSGGYPRSSDVSSKARSEEEYKSGFLAHKPDSLAAKDWSSRWRGSQASARHRALRAHKRDLAHGNFPDARELPGDAMSSPLVVTAPET